MTAPEQTGFEKRVESALKHQYELEGESWPDDCPEKSRQLERDEMVEIHCASDAPLHALADEWEQSKNSFARAYFKIAAEQLRALLSPRSVSQERKEAE